MTRENVPIIHQLRPFFSGLLVFLLLFGSTSVLAQSIVFNEITYWEPSLKDEDGQLDNGWIELKNIGNSATSTKDLVLVLNDTLRWELPDLQVDAKNFVFIWLSGKDRHDSLNLHASFQVENIRGNSFKILNKTNQSVTDNVTIHSRLDWYESYSRFSSDGDNWYHVKTRTPKSENETFGFWKRVSYTAAFRPRDSAPTASLYYKNKFWIFSGWTGDSFNPSNEVWASPDLKEWELVNASAPYKGDAFFIVFNNAIWAFDGDAYTSKDGITWDKVAQDLPFSTANRISHFKGRLWVVTHKKIFSSLDGINWETAVEEAPWEARELPGFLMFKGKLWFFGGAKAHQSQNPAFRDVWSSSDGIHWDLVTDEAEWPGKAWFGYKEFDNKIWIFSGWDFYKQDDTNDVWFSEDGITWTEFKSSTTWEPRHAPYSWVARGSLWISSGYYTMHLGLFNDVWKLDSLHRYVADTFYLKPLAIPEKLSSWGNKADGAGFPPKDFGHDNQSFMVTNNTDVVVQSDWVVSGRSSSVTIGNGIDSITVEIRPATEVKADIRQAAFSSVKLRNRISPHFLSADENSTVTINTDEKLFILQAEELSNLYITKGRTYLVSSPQLKKSLHIERGTIDNGASLNYSKRSILYYESDSNYESQFIDLPVDSKPSKIIVDCNCIIVSNKSESIDSLVLKKGRIKLNDAEWQVGKIDFVEKAGYFITENNGFLSLKPSDGDATFPIGTSFSYNPVRISNSLSTMLRATVWHTDTLSCVEGFLNVAWKIEGDIGDKPTVTLHWEPTNENRSTDFYDLGISRWLGYGWEAQTQESLQRQIYEETDLKISRKMSLGTLSIHDNNSDCVTTAGIDDIVSVYPNPSNGIFYVSPLTAAEVPTIVIYDLNGKIVESINPSYNEDYSYEVKSSLRPGLFYMQIDSPQGRTVHKIVIH